MSLQTRTQTGRADVSPEASPARLPGMDAFAAMPPDARGPLLEGGVLDAHRLHYVRNVAYRRAVHARGVGETTCAEALHLLLRPASLTFKGYVDAVGPFPQEAPRGFLSWLDDQLSVPLPVARARGLRRRYLTMEGLLAAVERLCAGVGLEMLTSSGTSGIASVVPRDAASTDLAVRSFFAGIRRSWGVARGSAMVFVMPERTRVAMARSARIGIRQLDWASDTPVFYTMPFAATPDLIRLRGGRSFYPGLRGLAERRILHPALVRADARFVAGRFVAETRVRLRELCDAGRPLMLLGGAAQLHAVAQAGPLRLPPGSRVATGGGSKERYPVSPAGIRDVLEAAFPGTPVADVYGMAEADWAAFECSAGNHHLPPWIYAVVTDDADRIVAGPRATGMLAFYDPVAGGEVLPPFFQTADRVTLINGGSAYEPGLRCACGDDSAYIEGGVWRADLMGEAGCAAQL